MMTHSNFRISDKNHEKDFRLGGDENSEYNPLAKKRFYLYPANEEKVTEENIKRIIFFNETFFDEYRNQNPFKEEDDNGAIQSSSSTSTSTTPSYNSSSSSNSTSTYTTPSTSTYSTPSYNYSYKPEPKKRFWGFSAGYVQKQWQSKEGGSREKMGFWEDSKVVHGVQAGFRATPYFKFGLGLNTGLLYEYYYTKSQRFYGVFGYCLEHEAQ